MNYAIRLLLFLSVLLPAGFAHAETTNSPLTSLTSEDDWFDGSRDTKEVCCYGSIDGREVSVVICNVTTNALVINRTIRDFGYAIKYKDVKNESRVFERACLTEDHMGWVEILYEQKTADGKPRPDCMRSTSFGFELPEDCACVECVAVEIEIAHLSEIGKCRTAGDLQRLFLKNTFRKVVDFGLDTTPKDVSHTKRQSPKSRNEQ